MRRSRFPMKRQPATPVGDVAARHIVTHARPAGSEQRGSEVSPLLLVQGDNANTGQPGARNPLRCSGVRSTAAGGRFWAIARATSYWARPRSGRLLFGEALAREG